MNLKDVLKRYQTRIEAFGFVYRPYYHTAILLSMYLSVILFGYYFKMHLSLFTLVVLSLTLSIPIFLYLQYEYSYDENCFKEYTSYIQQVSSAFKTYPKINTAMQETLPILHSDLRRVVLEAIEMMENGEEYESALFCVEKEHSHYILQNLHRLMIAVEVHGAKQYEEGIHLLQDDLDDLIEDMYLHQKELLLIQKKVFLLCLLSIVISFMSKNMLVGLYAFEKSLAYQMVLFIFVVSLLVCIVLSQVFLRHTWVIWEKKV